MDLAGGAAGLGLPHVWGSELIGDNLQRYSFCEVARVAWILRLVEAGAGGGDRGTAVMEIAKPGDLRGRVAWASGRSALTPTPFEVMQCGRTPGVPAPACGSEHGRQRPPRSPDAGPCGSAARHRSPA